MIETEVAIIGGGIQGAGVAQAAAAAGYKTIIFEKTGWADGTSSRSSKLIHGGLRYLETADISLVRHNLEERELLLRNAPDLVHATPFYIPVYRGSTRPAWQMHIGLMLYRLLAGMSRTAAFRRVAKDDWSSLDSLETRDLKAVLQYWDAQTDDRLLTRAVVKSAVDLGAQAHCPAELISAQRSPEGFRLQLIIDGKETECQATTVVNAGGPWINEIQQRLDPNLSQQDISLVRGSHIILPGHLDKGIYYLQSPRDHRPLFAMPWHNSILVGTTEYEHTGSPDNVVASQEEIDYLLEAYAQHFPNNEIHVLDSFAGLRVLPADKAIANKRSRETILLPDNKRRPQTVAIYGGKLTAFRHCGEMVMRKLKKSLPPRKPVANTRTLRVNPA